MTYLFPSASWTSWYYCRYWWFVSGFGWYGWRGRWRSLSQSVVSLNAWRLVGRASLIGCRQLLSWRELVMQWWCVSVLKQFGIEVSLCWLRLLCSHVIRMIFIDLTVDSTFLILCGYLGEDLQWWKPHSVEKSLNSFDMNCGPSSDHTVSCTNVRQSTPRNVLLSLDAVVSCPMWMMSGQSVLLSGSLGGKGELVADIPVAAALLWDLVSVWLLRSKHDSIGVVDKACLAALNAALHCDVMNSFFFVLNSGRSGTRMLARPIVACWQLIGQAKNTWKSVRFAVVGKLALVMDWCLQSWPDI